MDIDTLRAVEPLDSAFDRLFAESLAEGHRYRNHKRILQARRIRAAIRFLFIFTDGDRPRVRQVAGLLKYLAAGVQSDAVARALREEFPTSAGWTETACSAEACGWQKGSSPGPYPGIYAIFESDRLAYIGSSASLRTRLGSHPLLRQLRGEGKSPSVRFRYTRPVGEHLAAEYRLILRLKPPMNNTVVQDVVGEGA